MAVGVVWGQRRCSPIVHVVGYFASVPMKKIVSQIFLTVVVHISELFFHSVRDLSQLHFAIGLSHLQIKERPLYPLQRGSSAGKVVGELKRDFF